MARTARSENGSLWWGAAIVAVTLLGVGVALHAPAPAPPVVTGSVGQRAPVVPHSRSAPPPAVPEIAASGAAVADGDPPAGDPVDADPVAALRAALTDVRGAGGELAAGERRALRTRLARSYRAALPRLTEAERHDFFAELTAANGELEKPEPTPDL